MAISQKSNVAYSFNQPLSGIFPAPIVANRAPLSTDKAQVGSVWIYKALNQAWILTSVVNNSASWVSVSGAAGTFSTLAVSGNSTLGSSTGSAVVLGNAGAGTTVAFSTPVGTPVTSANGYTATAGNITAANGNVVISTAATYLQLPGPVKIMSGAGVPAGALATAIGDMYINTTAASATTRLYIATAVGTFTNVTCAA